MTTKTKRFKIKTDFIVDNIMVASLLGIPVLPLIVFRYFRPPQIDSITEGLFLLWLVCALIFTLRQKRTGMPVEPIAKSDHRDRALRGLAICLFLLILAIITFYVPMRRYFWTGHDEASYLHLAAIWSPAMDSSHSRPMASLGQYIALQFSPNTFDGFLWLDLMVWYSSALLVYGIVRLTVKIDGIALTAALLFLVSPVEPSRLFGIISNTYILALFLLLLALWLYVQAFLRNARWLLVLSCLVLGVCLLSQEGGLVLAFVLPVLLLVLRRDRPFSQVRLWATAWIGTVFILTARFAVYLISPGYQGRFSSNGYGFAALPTRLTYLLLPTLNFISPSVDSLRYLIYGLPIAGLAVIAIALTTRRLTLAPLRSSAIRGILISIFFVVAGVLTFVPVVTVYDTVRTQFYVLPVQAIFWTLVVVLIGTFLPRHAQRFWLPIAVGVVVATGTASVVSVHESGHGIYGYQTYPQLTFPKLVRAFQMVHATAPEIVPETVIVFILDDPTVTPIALNYALADLSESVLGVKAFQINYLDPGQCCGQFTETGITFCYINPPDMVAASYADLIAFRLANDGSATLLERLPGDLVSPYVAARQYNPHARIKIEQITPLRFLR